MQRGKGKGGKTGCSRTVGQSQRVYVSLEHWKKKDKTVNIWSNENFPKLIMDSKILILEDHRASQGINAKKDLYHSISYSNSKDHYKGGENLEMMEVGKKRNSPYL